MTEPSQSTPQPTPLTDAATEFYADYGLELARADTSRELERALAQARAEKERAERERDEAFRNAATIATSFLVGDPANGIPLRNPMPHEIAERILAEIGK